MTNYECGEPVYYKGHKAIIADRQPLDNTYVLWDATGQKELCAEDGWIPAEQLSKRELTDSEALKLASNDIIRRSDRCEGKTN